MEIDLAEIPPLAGFTGKERDVETGLDYFGARYYESWSARWLSVDPLANKYPGWSPYGYVEDNPVAIVDPHGDTIITSLLNNDQVKEWNTRVAEGMKSNAFATVYKTLQNSTAKYYIEIGKGVKEDAGGDFKPNVEGKLHTGGTITLTPQSLQSLLPISHELFHGYQNDLGPYVHGSTGLELEAFLFQQKVEQQLHGGILTLFENGSQFDAPYESLLTKGFNNEDWDSAIDYFNESVFNSGHLYDRLDPKKYSNPLIERFLH